MANARILGNLDFDTAIGFVFLNSNSITVLNPTQATIDVNFGAYTVDIFGTGFDTLPSGRFVGAVTG